MGTVTQVETAIVGAGIAGLVCALALAQRGREVTLIEAFEAPSEVGAGLQVSPNASHIIEEFGLLGALAAKAVHPKALHLGDAVSGQTVLTLPVNADPDAPPYLTVHRAVLHDTLYVAAKADVRITPLTGHRIVEVSEDDDAVTLIAAHAGERVEIRAQSVIGADGIWSVLRNAVAGAAQPDATGRVALRAVVPADDAVEADHIMAWMAPGAHLVTYPVRNASTRNVVAVTRGEAGEKSWSQGVELNTIDTLIKALGKTPYAGIAERAEWTLWPLYSVGAEGAWHSRRIGLIGDAAHGIEPFAAQGAAMAIEDGYEMAAMIDEAEGRPHRAFTSFHAKRKGRVERVAKRTAFNRFTYHQAGLGRMARNAVLKNRSPQSFMRSLQWLYDYRA